MVRCRRSWQLEIHGWTVVFVTATQSGKVVSGLCSVVGELGHTCAGKEGVG